MKKIFAVLLSLILAIFCAVPAFAVGEGNMSGGGGGMGDGSNASYWNPGMDGIRVSVVDAQNRTVAATIDISSVTVASSVAHFGKVCKLTYNNGKVLSAKVGGYSYIKPAQALPTIISSSGGTNIATIKSYFTDEQVIRSIARNVGMNFEVLTNGKYKMMIEPIAYFCFHGQQFAMTATEAALYDQKMSGRAFITI